MAKGSVKLNAKQLVADIRKGMDGETLMTRYELSRSQLEKVLDKLIKHNLIAVAEFSNHLSQPESPYRSSVENQAAPEPNATSTGAPVGDEAGIVEKNPPPQSLVDRRHEPPKDMQIPISETQETYARLVKDIRGGKSESRLMRKYKLSKTQLDSMKDVLAAKGFLTHRRADKGTGVQNNLPFAIFCLLWFLPFGIFATVRALEARRRIDMGDYDRAVAASKAARRWCWASVFAPLVVLGGFILLAASSPVAAPFIYTLF